MRSSIDFATEIYSDDCRSEKHGRKGMKKTLETMRVAEPIHEILEHNREEE